MIKTDDGDRHLLPPAVFQVPGEEPPRYVINFDQNGVIRAHTRGGWSLEEVDRYFAHLGAFVAEARKISGRAKLLIDRRETPSSLPPSMPGSVAPMPNSIGTAIASRWLSGAA